PGDEKIHEVVDVAGANLRKAGHASGSLANDRRDLVARAALADALERGHRTGAFLRLAVATGAIVVVERRVVVRNQPYDPRHLVRIHVQEGGVRVERRAAPFGAAVEAGKD